MSLGSQTLLSAPVTGVAGVWLFVLAQAVLIVAWIALHRRRLRDAGRPSGMAIGIALVYALEVALLTLLIWALTSPGALRGDPDAAGSYFQLYAVVYMLAALSGDPHLGAVHAWMTGLAIVLVLPIVIGVAFSFWTATRPSAPVP
jgi:uncharacterized membrane protein YhaH (DUF805 family)